MKNINKQVSINKVIVGLQRCSHNEFKNNELVKEYLSARLAILELN